MRLSTVVSFVFGVGVGVGSSATYFNKKYKRILDEESIAFREYRLKVDKYSGDEEDELENNSDPIVNGPVEFIRPKKGNGRVVKQYHSLSKKPSLDPGENIGPSEEDDYHNDSPPDDDPEDMPRILPTDGGPYIISLDEFADEFQEFDKITLYYYELDDTLTEENEEVIIDVSDVVGDEALSEFGTESNNDDIVYVRNPSLRADYEIIRLVKSYQETVLGIFRNEPKRRKYNGENE